MAKVFVSYRSADYLEADRLAEALREAGHSVALDIWAINVGDSILSWMNQELENAHYLVMCYSSSGLAPWMNQEWMSTLARQLNGENIKILPVLLTGGKPPAILADIKYANLIKNWDEGIALILKALK